MNELTKQQRESKGIMPSEFHGLTGLVIVADGDPICKTTMKDLVSDLARVKAEYPGRNVKHIFIPIK